jgi:hypothetical protein
MKTRTHRSRSSDAQGSSIEPAIVEQVGDRVLRVRRAGDGASREVVEARLARIAGYTASVGDRVMASFGESESYVIAVLHAASPEQDGGSRRSLVLADGARVEADGAKLELRDADGHLLVRYEDGHAEIAAPAGDLRLSAPSGRVVISSALDVELASGRDVKVEAARRFEVASAPRAGGGASASFSLDGKRAALRAPEIEVTSKGARFVAARAEVISRSIAVTAEHVAEKVTKIEIDAERVIERTKDTFREVEGLAQTCAGTMRSLVKDVFSLHSRRSVMKSSDDTSIDGSKVLLG